MLYKILALIVHQSPKETSDRHFLQLIVARNSCLGSELLMDVFPMESMRTSVRPASQKLALSAPSSRNRCQLDLPRSNV